MIKRLSFTSVKECGEAMEAAGLRDNQRVGFFGLLSASAGTSSTDPFHLTNCTSGSISHYSHNSGVQDVTIYYEPSNSLYKTLTSSDNENSMSGYIYMYLSNSGKGACYAHNKSKLPKRPKHKQRVSGLCRCGQHVSVLQNLVRSLQSMDKVQRRGSDYSGIGHPRAIRSRTLTAVMPQEVAA